MGKIKLRIEFLDMAREFFSSLPEKVQQKITYNFLKIEGGEINKDIFKKNWKTLKSGNSVHCSTVHVTAFSPFGTQNWKRL